MSGRGNRPELPTAPGWYPDPFSADGRGERYFDGRRWGTSERPLGRHGNTPPTRLPTGTARRVHRVRRSMRDRTDGGSRLRRAAQPTLVVVAFVGAAVALAHFQHPGSPKAASDAFLPTLPVTTAPPTDHPPPSAEEKFAPLGEPARVPAGTGDYELEDHQPNDPTRPVAYDPCRPIHYVVNGAGAPEDGLALIQLAIARVQSATGLHFVYDGPTSETPDRDRPPYQPARYGASRWAPVLIAWSDEKAFPELAGYTEGVGGSSIVQVDANDALYVSGQLVLDRVQLAAAALPDRALAKAVILHELGHVVGLAHTADRNELMFSEAQFNVRDFGVGDLRGLAVLGTQRCYPGT